MKPAAVAKAKAATFPSGVRPAENKLLAESSPIEVIPTPSQVAVPLLQHTGSAAEATVKAKQEVALGELIGKSTGFISASVHASVAGTVGRTSVATLPNGRHVQTIPIKSAEQALAGRALYGDIFAGDWPTAEPAGYDGEKITAAVTDAGIVGLGGAAFPTHVKLVRNAARPIDTLLVNGCECEPYLTADFRIMIEAPRPIVSGAVLAARAAGAERIIVAIEDNKPEAVEEMRQAADGTGVEIKVLKTKYPQGSEKQAIQAVLGREVPGGGLPLDVGVLVINVGTAAAVARAVLRGKPLTHRVVTVSGRGIAKAKNLLVPIGISYRELIDYCGGLTERARRVIAGGPMMGFALGDLDTPVTKGTSGVVVLTDDDVSKAEETACVRCGRCVDACPMRLVPTRIAAAAKARDWDLVRRYHIPLCMECGCCAYVCPASIPLVQLIRMGKAEMPGE
ncbi:MAG: electron transport complex subunit RsxC [Planctomycetota bacterium]|jgi:electron transport complex protein RnfC